MDRTKLNIVVQSGGKLFKSGAYGCIFSPPLKCKSGSTTPSSKKVGKLTELIDIKYEIHSAKYLANFPESKKYFILPEPSSLCAPADMAKQANDSMNDCEILKSKEPAELMQFQMEMGGKSLKSSLATMNPTNIPFFDFMENLLEIGAFLLLKGVVHNDMHGNNILIDDEFVPRLIDFGRTYTHNIITRTLIQEMNVYYNAHVNQIPPEHTAQPGVQEGVSFETIMNDLYHHKMPLIYAERVLGVSRKEQLAEFRSFWEDSISVKGRDWVRFYKMYWPVVDSWAIGHNLIGILRILLLSKEFTESTEWKQKQGVVKSVLRSLLKADPRRRSDALEALAMYNPMHPLVVSARAKEWMEKKQSIFAH
jgi:hypothetical protein